MKTEALTINLDQLIIEGLVDFKINSSVLHIDLQSKLIRLANGKTSIDKFSLEEKMLILSSMNIRTYIVTINEKFNLHTAMTNDIVYGLHSKVDFRQVNAVNNLSKKGLTVSSDKDIARFFESVYITENKPSIMKTALAIKNSNTKLTKNLEAVKELNYAVTEAVKFVSKIQLSEKSILIENRLNKSQLTILFLLNGNLSLSIKELFKNIAGSSKKKYMDLRALEDRQLIHFINAENKTTKAALITSQGKLVVLEIIKKHL